MQQIWQLRRRISAEIAYAGSLNSYGSRQVFKRFILVIERVIPEMPVLAIEAMKCASMGKHCEVLIAVFRTFYIGIFGITTSASARADPIAYAIGGQRIVVP
jgi:hypothetical protein